MKLLSLLLLTLTLSACAQISTVTKNADGSFTVCQDKNAIPGLYSSCNWK